MKKPKKTIRGIGGLEYFVFENVPVRSTSHGDVIDMEPQVLEKLAAHAILERGIPLRGQEIQFLRKVLGLSLEKFANKLGLSSGAIFKWEKASKERLLPVNEVSVRALVAEEMGIELSGRWTVLKGTAKSPSELTLRVA